MVVPNSVRLLLHDYALPSRLDAAVWERLIVERVMERGNWEAMRWLLAQFGRARLSQYLRERGHRVLPPRELRFWSLVTGIPNSVADQWVRRARDRVRAWR